MKIELVWLLTSQRIGNNMDIINKDLAIKIKDGKPFYKEQYIYDVFSWEELESILNLAPFLNDERFHIINNKRYEWGKYWWQSDITAYPTHIVKEEINHHVCYMQDASRVNKTINQIASDLEFISNCPTDAHIFFSLTTNENEGLGIHNDVSSNFIIQVEGQTNFKVWDIIAEEGVSNIDKIEEQPVIDIVLSKGDVIYIPHKYWHHAISKTKRLSVSFPMSVNGDKVFASREWINIER